MEVKPGESQKRFVLEGTWGGYSSNQVHVCYRRVIHGNMVKRYSRVTSVIFSDGTNLYLNIRPRVPREKVVQLRSYDNLVDDAVYSERTGFVQQTDLEADHKARIEASRREVAKAGA